jgi:PEP-CTERM motif
VSNRRAISWFRQSKSFRFFFPGQDKVDISALRKVVNRKAPPTHPMRCYTPIVLFASSFLALQCASAVTIDVVGWLSGTGDGPLSQTATNDPIVGDGTSNSAESEAIYASISGQVPTLTQVGDSISLAGSVTLEGSMSGDEQFRWGLYDVNGKPAVSGWQGYFALNGITGTGCDLMERNQPNGATFWTSSSATSLASTSPAAAPFSAATYAFTLSIARTIGDQLQIDWSLVRTSGTGTYNTSSSFLDTTASTFSFNRVGFHLGGVLDADRATFQDITVTYVPEPSSAVLGMIGVASLVLRRRRDRSDLRVAVPFWIFWWVSDCLLVRGCRLSSGLSAASGMILKLRSCLFSLFRSRS